MIKVQISRQEHVLSFDDFGEESHEGYLCERCKQKISGPAYKCEDCSFWLHKSCAFRTPPHEIINPTLHGDHPLRLGDHGGYFVEGDRITVFVCNKCLYAWDVRFRHSYYYCAECNVAFDMECAAPTDQHSKESERQMDKQEQKILHFSHGKILLFSKGWKDKENICNWCRRPITSMCYACSYGPRCEFILHESCLKDIPTEITHPFHPLHPLHITARNFNYDGECQACKKSVPSWPSHYPCPGFYCKKCNFFLHVDCANLPAPSLKLNLHEHRLSYFPTDFWRLYHFPVDSIWMDKSCGPFCCNKCGTTELGGLPFFYRCVQCDINFHSECIPVPPTAKYRYHEHILFLRDPKSIDEPFDEEFYCDICEEERNPNHHVYYCKDEDCKFIAHIECVISEPVEVFDVSDLEMAFGVLDVNALVDKNEERNEEDESEGKRLPLCFLGHPLSFSEVFEKDEDPYCLKCGGNICCPAYACGNCNIYLHKVCAELPDEIQHPHHSKHPLTLYQSKRDFICDRCGDINLSSELYYRCQICGVKLDMKCADLVPLKTEHQKLTKMLPMHQHAMSLGHYCMGSFEYFCSGCQQPFLQGSLVYCCFKSCRFFLHEYCASSLPSEIHHPQNSFLAKCGSRALAFHCSACKLPTGHLAYFGNLGGFHYICCASLGRALKHESHEHQLHYFGIDHQRFYYSCRKFYNYTSYGDIHFKCTRCNKTCEGAFYGCVQCRFRLHLDCVPIPRIVKGKCHRHPLTLMDSFVEGGYHENDYYCDACEEKRNIKHHVYVCEQCPLKCSFVAHIECMLSSKNNPEIIEFGHEHPLSLSEIIEKDENLYCNKCAESICGPAYTCGKCNFCLDKLCAELPNEIRHPCHSQHPLTLSMSSSRKKIICNMCRCLSVCCVFYHCQHCGIVLDKNCAALE